MASKIDIISNAHLLLGDSTKASVSESIVGANLYDSTYESLLTSYRWRFASKKLTLARLTEEPLNQYNYQFQLPADFLYLTKTDSSDYEIYGDKVYSNSTTMEVDYIFKVTEDKLPAYVVKTLELFLAAQFAIPVTGSKDLASLYFGMYRDSLRIAKFTDASQRPPDEVESSPYTDVRY